MATRIGVGTGGRAPEPLDGDFVLQRYYAGDSVPCPVGCGGASEIVRVSTSRDGGGEIWMECMSCAQRGQYAAPPASELESRGTVEAVESGREPSCPRHALRAPLSRLGRKWVCRACGVRYRD